MAKINRSSKALYVSFDNLKNLYNELKRLPKRHLLVELAKQTIALNEHDPIQSLRLLSYVTGYSPDKTMIALEDLYQINKRWSFDKMPEDAREFFIDPPVELNDDNDDDSHEEPNEDE